MVHFFLCPEIFHGKHKDGKRTEKENSSRNTKTHRGNKNEIKSKLAQVQKLGNKK